MKKENKEFLRSFIGIVLPIAVIISLSVGVFLIDRKERQKCIDNPPTIRQVEEELEYVFMTTFVVVNEWEQEDYECYYEITANNLDYRVRYGVVNDYPCSWGWEYQNHIQIGVNLWGN